MPTIGLPGIDQKIVLYDGPPPEREWRVRTPIARPKTNPTVRHNKRRQNIALGPAVKERSLDGGPVAQQPRLDELRRADQVEAIHIPWIAAEENLVVRDPRRNDRDDVGLSARE